MREFKMLKYRTNFTAFIPNVGCCEGGDINVSFNNADVPAIFDREMAVSIPFFDMMDLIGDENADSVLKQKRGRGFTFKQLSEINFVQEDVYVKMPVQHFDILKPGKVVRF